MNRTSISLSFTAIGAIAFVAGCATAMPSGRQEASAGAIRAAEEVGAPRVPQAALHLQLAKEQSDHAKQLIASGDKEGASSLLMRAQADAELAVALVRESDDRASAQQAVEKVRMLQETNK